MNKLPSKWTTLTVTTVGVFMGALDSRIVIVGIPQIAAALNADAEQAIWFTQAFQLISTTSMLMIGRVADIVGRLRLYKVGFILFTIFSAATSLAQDPYEVIIMRGLQGLSAAILFTSSIALVAERTPRGELGFALGINQVGARVGSVAGLTVGGVILSVLDWRALFYINIPVGIFGTIWAHMRIKELEKPEKGGPLDLPGFLAFSVSITSFLLALTFVVYGIGGEEIAIPLLIVSAASLFAFILREIKTSQPLVDLQLFRIRVVSGGLLALIFNGLAFGASLLLLSIYFQLVRGMTPFAAGIMLLPYDFAFVSLAPIVGRLSDKYGHLPFTTSGLSLVTLSLLLMSTADTLTPLWLVSLYLVLLGAGIGVFNAPNTSAIMGAVPSSRRGVGSGLRSTFFNVGFTISLNLVIFVMTFTVPYSIVTRVVSSGAITAVSQSETILFAKSIKSAFLWLAVINALAIPPSVLRGKRKSGDAEKPKSEES